MKIIQKTFLTIIFIYSSFIIINAQKIGIVGGINNSTQVFGSLIVIDAKPITALHFGVIATSPKISNLSFSGELHYSQKGYKYLNSGSSQNKLNYIEAIPEINIDVFGPLSLGLGGTLAIKLSEKFKFENNDWIEVNPVQYKNLDMGLTAKAKITFGDLFFQARYIHGLSNITAFNFTDALGSPIIDTEEIYFKNRTLQVGMGWMF